MMPGTGPPSRILSVRVGESPHVRMDRLELMLGSGDISRAQFDTGCRFRAESLAVIELLQLAVSQDTLAWMTFPDVDHPPEFVRSALNDLGFAYWQLGRGLIFRHK